MEEDYVSTSSSGGVVDVGDQDDSFCEEVLEEDGER